MALQASDALRNACDKGQSWFTNRASKIKTLKNGYNKIRPKLFPKGLTTFKKEHCDKFDDVDEQDRFLKYRSRFHSVDVIDNKLRAEFNEHFNDLDCNRIEDNSNTAKSINGWLQNWQLKRFRFLFYFFHNRRLHC